jgi:hypothetical protein
LRPYVRLEKEVPFWQINAMSFTEMKELLPTLTAEERASLFECLQALEEGVSVEEFRALKAAIEESLLDTSPTYTAEEMLAEIDKLGRSDAAAA